LIGSSLAFYWLLQPTNLLFAGFYNRLPVSLWNKWAALGRGLK
jgi:hypothetical protein